MDDKYVSAGYICLGICVHVLCHVELYIFMFNHLQFSGFLCTNLR